MGLSQFLGLFVFLLLSRVIAAATKSDVKFDQNYYITWGNDHVLSLNQGRAIQLSMDRSSG